MGIAEAEVDGNEVLRLRGGGSHDISAGTAQYDYAVIVSCSWKPN
jgi:hypothetical protein